MLCPYRYGNNCFTRNDTMFIAATRDVPMLLNNEGLIFSPTGNITSPEDKLRAIREATRQEFENSASSYVTHINKAKRGRKKGSTSPSKPTGKLIDKINEATAEGKVVLISLGKKGISYRSQVLKQATLKSTCKFVGNQQLGVLRAKSLELLLAGLDRLVQEGTVSPENAVQLKAVNQQYFCTKL